MALIHNKEMRFYLGILVLINVLLILVLTFVIGQNTQKLHQQTIQERIALLGSILQSYPHLEDEIMPFLTERATPEQISIGIEIAERYGIETGMPLDLSTNFSIFHNGNQKIFLTFGLTLILVTMSIIIIMLHKFYGQVRSFADYAEGIVEGRINLVEEIPQEGDFPKLINQYNNMAKRLQGTMEDLKKEKIYLKNIVSDISHQLKTPLTSLKMFNDLLLEGEIEDIRTATDFVGKSQEQIERMEWLIKNLLKMARLETNSIEFNNIKQDINTTIRESYLPLQKLWQGKNINITEELADSMNLNHDKNWLAEALSNIVKNAIEHTPKGGHIRIATSESPLAIRIMIQNSGEKITKEELPFIFDRFYRGKRNTKVNSTGIGLALSKAIVENQNGVIDVKNSEIGPLFIITLYKDESI